MTPKHEAVLKTAAVILVSAVCIMFPVLFGAAGLAIVMFGWLAVMIGGMIYLIYKSFLFKAEMRQQEEESNKRWEELEAKYPRYGKTPAK